MKNIEGLRADYWLNKLINYLLHFKNTFTLQNEYVLPLISGLVVIILVAVIRRIYATRRMLNEPSMLLELTPPSFTEQEAYTTDQLFSVIHALGNQRSFKDRLLGVKPRFSLEIVSTQSQGIRYLVRTSPKQVNTLKRSLQSYLPFLRIKTANEYLPESTETLKGYSCKVLEFKLAKHFAFSLRRQNELEKHDPIAYLTGMMTKLAPSELISLQIVLTPSKNIETKKIHKLLSANGNVIKYLRTPGLLKWLFYNNYSVPQTKSPSEMDVVSLIDAKINQQLFESTIRLLIVSKDKEDLTEREQGFKSSFSTFSSNGYQSITLKRYLNLGRVKRFLFYSFRKRVLSFTDNSILSISEVSGIYHFPYAGMTKTENIIKSHSKDLPAPVSLKQTNRTLDILLGQNSYNGSTTPIGLTKEERDRHVYVIGATGTGKTTMLVYMITQDILANKGVCFIDPHGDSAELLISAIPEKRTDNFIYFDPDDLDCPININLLELPEGLSDSDLEREKEWRMEAVVSLFHKTFQRSGSIDSHRIDYVLRNIIQTAFAVKGATIFTLYDLLNKPNFQKEVIKKLEDESLKDFWRQEFAKAGDFQRVKMAAGVTSKIGRFLFSPSVKRVLEKPKSTINFDDILNEGKVLICNFSKGKLGEENSELFGTMILTQLQMATQKRSRMSESKRKPFYVYVDEFQNFATPSFIQMLSESRKYQVLLTLAEQSTSQQTDRNLVFVTMANVGTVICFRTANPKDEEIMLPQFLPYIQKGEIQNLPRYKFYIKISAVNPEEPFSGETIVSAIKINERNIKKLKDASRKNYASIYIAKKQVKQIEIAKQESGIEQKSNSNRVSKVGVPDIQTA